MDEYLYEVHVQHDSANDVLVCVQVLHDHLGVVDNINRREHYNEQVQKIVEPNLPIDPAEQDQREDSYGKDSPRSIAVVDVGVFGAHGVDRESDPHGKHEHSHYEHVLWREELDKAGDHVGPEGCEREQENVVDRDFASRLFAAADDTEEHKS